MENELQIDNIGLLGQLLHKAETEMGIGRRAVAELLTQEPVDLEAVEARRQEIMTARLERNGLRQKLEKAKPPIPYRHKW